MIIQADAAKWWSDLKKQWEYSGYYKADLKNNIRKSPLNICNRSGEQQHTKPKSTDPHLSVRSPLCRLKSREGTILSMCWGSQMLACSSSFTVFLTTPCRPLIPAMRILEVTDTDIKNNLTGDCIYKWMIIFRKSDFCLYSSVCLYFVCIAIFNCSKMSLCLFSADDKDDNKITSKRISIV